MHMELKERCGLDGKPRNRDWCSGATGIRVQHLVMDDDALGGIGS
jgi:hypothetical protein